MPLAVLLILALAQPAPRAGSLPDLPHLNIDNFLPAVREQVQKAYAAAEANPKTPRRSGQLGMVLDAYEQYDAAAVCYRRAQLLDSALVSMALSTSGGCRRHRDGTRTRSRRWPRRCA